MNERFLIPSAVALTLHALVFCGFGRGDRPIPPPPEAASALMPVNAVQIDWPKDRDDPEAAPEPKGKPDEPRPDITEPPAPAVITEITIPREDPHVAPIHSLATLITGPIGVPDGWTGPEGPALIPSTGLDKSPRTRTQIAPVYPFEARMSGRAGEVFVEFTVDETGRVLDPHVLHSNDPLFEEPTLRAVAKWRFEPGRKNGRIVRFRMAVPVAFAVNQ